jgi:hypothetical protein
VSKLEVVSFVLAGLSFAIWLVAQTADVPVEQSYVLIAAMAFFAIGFGSLVVRYAKAVAPEWDDR